MKLIELFNQLDESLLLEARLDYLMNTFAQKLEDKWAQTQQRTQQPIHQTGEQVFQYLVSVDPSPQKKYTQWIIKLYLTDQIKWEDLYKAKEYLKVFMDNFPRLPQDKRDINAYKSLQELYTVVKQLENNTPEPSNKQQEREMYKLMHSPRHAEIVYDSNTLKVVIPKTKKASCYFGRNTQWCTAASSSHNMFDQYAEQGDLYIILFKKENKRYQFQLETKQFTDESDGVIDPFELIEKHPELNKVFSDEQIVNMRYIIDLWHENNYTVDDYILNRVRELFRETNATLGKYLPEARQFVLETYGDYQEITDDWYSEDSNIARIINGGANVYDNMDSTPRSSEIREFLDNIDYGTQEKLFDMMLTLYEKNNTISDNEQEELDDIQDDNNISGFLHYMGISMGFDPAIKLYQAATRSVERGIEYGTNKKAMAAARNHLENLQDHIVEESAPYVEFVMENMNDGTFELRLPESEVMELVNNLETNSAEGYGSWMDRWPEAYRASDLKEARWEDFDQSVAIKTFKDELNDSMWNFL